VSGIQMKSTKHRCCTVVRCSGIITWLKKYQVHVRWHLGNKLHSKTQKKRKVLERALVC